MKRMWKRSNNATRPFIFNSTTAWPALPDGPEDKSVFDNSCGRLRTERNQPSPAARRPSRRAEEVVRSTYRSHRPYCLQQRVSNLSMTSPPFSTNPSHTTRRRNTSPPWVTIVVVPFALNTSNQPDLYQPLVAARPQRMLLSHFDIQKHASETVSSLVNSDIQKLSNQCSTN